MPKKKNDPLQNIEEEKIDLNKKKKRKNASSNILEKTAEYINKYYHIKLNLDTKQVEMRQKVKKGEEEKQYEIIDDQSFRYLRVELEMNGISLSKDKLLDVLYSGYFFETYRPFKEYIFGLNTWNSATDPDYIAEWLKQVYLIDEEKHRQYFIEGFKKWFVALVVSLIVDKVHKYFINQACLIFTGKQGKFKSTFLDNLLPEIWRLRYYMEGIYDFHKEEHQKYLGQKVIINLAELSGFTRAEIEAIKSRITQLVVGFRVRYDREDTYWKRRASFVATTNDKEFLMDITGTRRFFVIPIQGIVINDDLNVDNIYAQAFALYKQGFKYWFDDEDIGKIELMNEDFKMSTLEESLVLDYYRKPDKEDYDYNNRVQYVNATEVANRLCTKFQRLNVNNSVVKNIGKAFSANGFIQSQVKVNGKNRRLWHVVEVEFLKVERPTNGHHQGEIF